MKIAVVGATGLVGTKMLEILAERNFPLTELILVASPKSVGQKIHFKGKDYEVVSMETAISLKPQIALFSAGGSTSLEWAPKFAEVGTTVIDNSSAWRMDADKPLVVPEVNAHIQMVVVLNPLHRQYSIKRVVVSTYQSVTGTGKKAVDQLMNERNGIKGEMAYRYPIDLNLIPQIDVFLDNGYTKEEMKMVMETKKIMGDASIQVTATAVRVPVMGGHSESVNIEFNSPFELSKVIDLLENTEGVVVQDNISLQEYPMPINAHNKDAVFVGRIRKDDTQANTMNAWIVSDNLRKGAATNAVQIAEYLVQNQLV
jgi:aspartate-semialdehyde dehydrogenase